MHWDELRHRPPPEGLSSEHWWLGIKLARRPLCKELPLLDMNDRHFIYCSPEPVQAALHRIDRDACGQIRMDEAIASPESRDRYIISSLIEEAITSSQLEGAATTRRVAKDMLRARRKPRDRNEQMIANNYEAMQFIREILDEPLTPDVIITLHNIVVQDTGEKGHIHRLRESDDTIRVVDGTHTRILHTPPPAAEIPERLERLCQFANQTEHDEPFLHPVLRAILLHFQLAYDHPFTDGNGRTARALFYWSLIRQGCWLAEYLSISSVLKTAPAQYGRAYLYTETDDNDTTYFIVNQLDVIEKAIHALHEHLARKTQEVRKMQRLLRRSPTIQDALNYRQMALLIHALKHPGELYRIEAHRVSHNVAYQTARIDLLRLAEMGLLEKLQAKRAFVFVAPEDLEARLRHMADDRSARGA